MAFLDMLAGLQDQQQLQSPFPTSAETGYGTVQNGVPPEVQSMNKPTTDPVEIDRRKAGWFQVVQHAMTDPNITRALTHFGAAMGQPFGMGDTLAGRFAQSVNVGRSAYDMGMLAQEQLDRQRKKDIQDQEAHEVGMAAKKAETKATEAGLTGIEARGRSAVVAATIAEQTQQSAIQQAVDEAELTKQKLKAAKTEQEKRELALEWEQRVARIKKGITDAKLQDSFEAEMAKPRAEVNKMITEGIKNQAQAAEARATVPLRGAQTEEASARARLDRAKATGEEDINKLPPEERGRARARATGSQSAQVQMLEAVKSEYRRANPGKSDQEVSQFALNYVSQKKPEDRAERFLKWQEAFGKSNEKPEEALKRFDDFEKMMAGGSTATATSDGDRTGLPQPKTLAERNALPKGTRYVAPDGSIRTRQ